MRKLDECTAAQIAQWVGGCLDELLQVLFLIGVELTLFTPRLRLGNLRTKGFTYAYVVSHHQLS